MVISHDFSQSALIDVGVDLRGGDIAVPEEHLDDPEIGTAGEEVRGEAMPEHMGVNVVESGPFRAPADDLPDGDAFEWSTGGGEEKSSFIAAGRFLNECAIEAVAVGINGIEGGLSDGDDALFPAFAGHEDDAEGVVDVFGEESAGFAGPKSCGVHEFEECLVSLPEPAVFGGGSGEQLFHLVRREDAGEFPPARWCFEESGGILGDAGIRGEKSEEDANGGEVSGDGAGLESALGVESSQVVGELPRGHLIEIGDGEGMEIGEEVVEVSSVGILGGGGHTGFDAQVGQEFTYRSREGGVVIHGR